MLSAAAHLPSKIGGDDHALSAAAQASTYVQNCHLIEEFH